MNPILDTIPIQLRIEFTGRHGGVLHRDRVKLNVKVDREAVDDSDPDGLYVAVLSAPSLNGRSFPAPIPTRLREGSSLIVNATAPLEPQQVIEAQVDRDDDGNMTTVRQARYSSPLVGSRAPRFVSLTVLHHGRSRPSVASPKPETVTVSRVE